MKFLKFWDCHDILKEQCPRGLLTKNEHFRANCLWDVSRLYSENSIQTLLIFGGESSQKKLEGFFMEFSKHNWATISETICPEMLVFGKQASWTLFFQNVLTNPRISEISFMWRHTLVLYCCWCNYKLNTVLLIYVHFYITSNLVCTFYHEE